jgi:hypothetical protein
VASTVRTEDLWVPEDTIPRTLPIGHQIRSLLRFAVLAPSTRNTQPWRFTIDGNAVLLRADPVRWLRMADPDRRELHLSLGCALENLLVAADRFGYRHTLAYFPVPADSDLAAVATFTPAPRTAPPAASAVTLETLQLRRTERRPFLPQPLPPDVLQRLRSVPGEPGVRLELTDATDRRRGADVLNVRAWSALFGDAEYREELTRTLLVGEIGGSWLAGQLRRPSPPYTAVGRRLAQQNSLALLSAPLIGAIGSLSDTPADQVRSGRLLERLWLTAVAEGLALHPMSQALEVGALRHELAERFPAAGNYVQQFFRLGRPSGAARGGRPAPRRPVEEVLAAAGPPARPAT